MSPLDDVLLDRLAIAAAAAVERYGPARTTMADPALVELVISSDSDEAARARALRLLGFAVDLPVRVVAVRSRLPLDRVGGIICPGRPVKAALLADVGVILATTVDPARFPAGVRAGVGAAASPDRSWRQARTALRFTSSREPVIRYADLGALALLAEIPQDAVRDNADVAAIVRVAATRRIWRRWTPTAPPAPCVRPPTFSICTTAAWPAASTRSARPSPSNSPGRPASPAPDSPSPPGASSPTERTPPRRRTKSNVRKRPAAAPLRPGPFTGSSGRRPGRGDQRAVQVLDRAWGHERSRGVSPVSARWAAGIADRRPGRTDPRHVRRPASRSRRCSTTNSRSARGREAHNEQPVSPPRVRPGPRAAPSAG